MLDVGLAMPAYYSVLKCSHAFNVLDARGVVSTAERARAFALMRRLSKGVAELWVARRGDLGLPLGIVPPPAPPVPLAMPSATEPAQLLFEIGVEELPAGEVSRAQRWLEATVSERLAATRLRHGEVRALGTPRRLVVLVEDVAPREDDSVERIRGPRVSAAFDADGTPTRADTGFATRYGVDPSALDRLTVEGVEYVAVVRQVEGQPAPDVLSRLLSQVVLDLRSERNMRWQQPVPPPAPTSSLSDLAQRVHAPTMTLDEQLALIARLRTALQHEQQRDAALQLLSQLRAREELLFHAAAREIDALAPGAAAPPGEDTEGRRSRPDRGGRRQRTVAAGRPGPTPPDTTLDRARRPTVKPVEATSRPSPHWRLTLPCLAGFIAGVYLLYAYGLLGFWAFVCLPAPVLSVMVVRATRDSEPTAAVRWAKAARIAGVVGLPVTAVLLAGLLRTVF